MTGRVCAKLINNSNDNHGKFSTIKFTNKSISVLGIVHWTCCDIGDIGRLEGGVGAVYLCGIREVCTSCHNGL